MSTVGTSWCGECDEPAGPDHRCPPTVDPHTALPRQRGPLDGYAVILIEEAAVARLEDLATAAIYGTDATAVRRTAEAVGPFLAPIRAQLSPRSRG